ncbi:MAG TPA: hypothetical protein ENK33_10490 [Desulfobacterales bacterium]|nr:hypothetical protein [Desulfobacterales bacterium]
MGGLSKKAQQFELTAAESKLPHITLDGGALLFKDLRLTRGQEQGEMLTAQAIVKAYNLMGYQAVGVSKYDLTAGLDFLRQISRESKFSWLSANLVNKKDHHPVFKPEILLTAGSIKIGVTALTGPAAGKLLKGQALLLPWQDTLPAVIKDLSKRKSDIIILLSSLPPQANKEIARRYQNINILLQAAQDGSNIYPQPLANTLICQTTKQGKSIGIMDINWQKSQKWGIDKAGLLRKDLNSLDRLDWRLAKYNQPEKEFKNLPAKLQVWRHLQGRRDKIQAEINRLKADIKNGRQNNPPSTFKNHFIAMETNLPDNPEISRIVRNLNQEINRLGRIRAGEIKAATESNYIGWRRCGKCHKAEVESWQRTRHAKAYETLVKKNRQYNLDCLFCHVTGIDRRHKLAALSVSTDLREVGCESCHGPGRAHAVRPGKNKMRQRPARKICLNCHTPAHDSSFNYATDIKLVHP